jgi:hypothetical protein
VKLLEQLHGADVAMALDNNVSVQVADDQTQAVRELPAPVVGTANLPTPKKALADPVTLLDFIKEKRPTYNATNLARLKDRFERYTERNDCVPHPVVPGCKAEYKKAATTALFKRADLDKLWPGFEKADSGTK